MSESKETPADAEQNEESRGPKCIVCGGYHEGARDPKMHNIRLSAELKLKPDEAKEDLSSFSSKVMELILAEKASPEVVFLVLSNIAGWAAAHTRESATDAASILMLSFASSYKDVKSKQPTLIDILGGIFGSVKPEG